jgi:hypothetical protein
MSITNQYIQRLTNRIYENNRDIVSLDREKTLVNSIYRKCLSYHKVYPYVSSQYGELGYNPCRDFSKEIKDIDNSIMEYKKEVKTYTDMINICKAIDKE